MNNPYQGQKIIFFDGICVLCNRSVDFLIKKDYKKRLKYASLQSGYAKRFHMEYQNYPLKEDTIIFYDEGRIFTKSTAILKISAYLKPPFSALRFFLIIPVSWRDSLYDLIARKRYHWFGKMDQCRLPDQETSGRIIG
jgi:predicted DCC family thiol-disulfide oxidoreductase YuxK